MRFSNSGRRWYASVFSEVVNIHVLSGVVVLRSALEDGQLSYIPPMPVTIPLTRLHKDRLYAQNES